MLANAFAVKAVTSKMDVAIVKPSSNHQNVQRLNIMFFFFLFRNLFDFDFSLAREGLLNKWWTGIAFAFVKKVATLLVAVVTAK